VFLTSIDAQVTSYKASSRQVDASVPSYILTCEHVQKHREALFLMGSMYIAGKHMKKDVKAAAWCFRNAADQVLVTIFDAD
jgi:TPR repeat protein